MVILCIRNSGNNRIAENNTEFNCKFENQKRPGFLMQVR